MKNNLGYGNILAIISIIALLCTNLHGQHCITEVSGITRLGDKIILVGDENTGSYFEYNISGMNLKADTVLRLDNQNRIKSKRLIQSNLPLDLEGVAILNYRTVVGLSERIRALVANDGVILEYDDFLSEFGGRGLEGLAFSPPLNGEKHWQSAVIWEGGYPEQSKLPLVLDTLLADTSLPPVIYTCPIDKFGKAGKEKIIILDMTEVNKWVDDNYLKEKEPHAYRFRAPDFVWHGDKFIVLLSSEAAVPKGNKWGPKILQVFDHSGKSLANRRILLENLIPGWSDKKHKYDWKNWEALAWFEKGKSLMLSYDTDDEHIPRIAIVNLPSGW